MFTPNSIAHPDPSTSGGQHLLNLLGGLDNTVTILAQEGREVRIIIIKTGREMTVPESYLTPAS
jgi:hypothetical protein